MYAMKVTGGDHVDKIARVGLVDIKEWPNVSRYVLSSWQHLNEDERKATT